MSDSKPKTRVIVRSDAQRRRMEDSVRRECRGRAVMDAKSSAVLTTNLWHGGRVLCAAETGEPILHTTEGCARLVRFRKETPRQFQNEEARRETERQNREIIQEGFKLAKHVGRRDPADVIAVVQCDDSDNYVIVGSWKPLATWLQLAFDRGLLESCEMIRNHRVPVVAAGSATSEATQRAAYKQVVREQKMSKRARDLARSAAHTQDEEALSHLCRCTSCGLAVAEHDDSACPHPAFVADTKLVGADKIQPTNGKPSGKTRKNRRQSTRMVIVGIDPTHKGAEMNPGWRDGSLEPRRTDDDGKASACPDWQRQPRVYCQKCRQKFTWHDDNGECPDESQCAAHRLREKTEEAMKGDK